METPGARAARIAVNSDDGTGALFWGEKALASLRQDFQRKAIAQKQLPRGGLKDRLVRI